MTKNTSVSMYLLDHGKVEHVSSCCIRPLQSSFCKLPAQGLMAAFIGGKVLGFKLFKVRLLENMIVIVLI